MFQIGIGDYSVYRGVLVFWDEDYDHRVLKVIDHLDPDVRSQLFSISESEGCTILRWRHSIPLGFEEGSEITMYGDVWTIQSSKTI
jgi:hypothetical protein